MTDTTRTANPNTGHGHVFPRPDGVKARCGGPTMCPVCALDSVIQKQRPKYPVSRLEPMPDRMKPCRDSEHTPPTHLHIPAGMQYRHICPSCGAEYLIQSSEVTM